MLWSRIASVCSSNILKVVLVSPLSWPEDNRCQVPNIHLDGPEHLFENTLSSLEIATVDGVPSLLEQLTTLFTTKTSHFTLLLRLTGLAYTSRLSQSA